MSEAGHPPPPWRLRGRAILLPALVRAPKGAGRRALRGAGGDRSLGGLLLAAYGPASTLAYHELLGIGGLLWSGVTPAAWLTHAHVDDAASLTGGREIWRIPKEAAAFSWRQTGAGEAVAVSVAGFEVVSVLVASRPRRVSVPVAAPFVGRDGSRRAWVTGRLRGAPVTAQVRVAPDGPLAPLAPVFSRTAVVGDVDLRIGVPREARRR